MIALVIGLLPYTYILWASAHHPVYSWGNVSSFRDLIGLITRRSYGSTQLVNTPGYTGGPPWPRLAALFASFDWLGGILIVAGAIEAYRRRRWFFWFGVIAFAFAGPFFVWVTNLNFQGAPSALFVLQRFFLLSHVALGRPGSPEDIARGALFLASDESAYCTGAEFVVDGGMTASSYHRVERAPGG